MITIALLLAACSRDATEPSVAPADSPTPSPADSPTPSSAEVVDEPSEPDAASEPATTPERVEVATEREPEPPFVPPVPTLESEAYLWLPPGTILYPTPAKKAAIYTVREESLHVRRVGHTEDRKWQVLLTEGELEGLEFVELWLFVPAGVGDEIPFPRSAMIMGVMQTPTQCCLVGAEDPDHRWQVEYDTRLYWGDGAPAGRVGPTLLFDVRGSEREVGGRSLTCFDLEPEGKRRKRMTLCIETKRVTQVPLESVYPDLMGPSLLVDPGSGEEQ